jgi:Xaa-Pro dipeptidase
MHSITVLGGELTPEARRRRSPVPDKRDVVARLAARAEDEGLDVLVAMSPENAAYAGGFPVPSQALGMRSRPVMALVTAGGRSRHIVVDMEESLAHSETALDEVLSYNEFTDDPIDALASSLTELVGAGAVVGLELDFLPHDLYQRLRGCLPRLEIRDAAVTFQRARMIKVAEEVFLLRAMARAAHEMHYQALAESEAGETELDVASRIAAGLFSRGADTIKELIVGSGERSWHANPAPTTRRLEPGNMIRVDILAAKRGYLSDCARTAVVGSPTDGQTTIWCKLLELRQQVLEMVKPGASTQRIYRAYARGLEQFGYRPIDFLGHGLGLTVHEQPYIDRFSDSTLEAGMVLAIEPYLMLPDRNWGFQLEDEVLVTDAGCERLTDASDDAELITVAVR